MRKKILITGSGHSGTTFVTECFKKGGYSVGDRAGNEVPEHMIKEAKFYPDLPDVAKHTLIPRYLPDLLLGGKLDPDRVQCVLLCWRRDVDEVVRALHRSNYVEPFVGETVNVDHARPFPFWKERYLAAMGKLVHALVVHEIPIIHMEFPRSILDYHYFEKKMTHFLGDNTEKIWKTTADPTRVHCYQEPA